MSKPSSRHVRRYRWHGLRPVARLRVLAVMGGLALLAAILPMQAARAGGPPASHGFVGYAKAITDVTVGGEPEVTVGAGGSPLLVAFNGCGIAVSYDRGNTFSVFPKDPADPGPTPGDPYHYCSDPVDAIGPQDVLYTGAGYWDEPVGDIDYYNMYVSHSADSGRTWSSPVYATGDRTIAQQLSLGRNTGHSDRLFLSVDNRTGTIYASASDFPRVGRWVVASHDGGQSFGPPHSIDSYLYPMAAGEQEISQKQGTVPDYIPAAANGVLAFTYGASAAPGAICPCGIFETTANDGVTWTRHFAPFIANWAAADPSHPGRFAIMSGQGVSAAPANPGYITVSTTSDDGQTWTKPVLIGQGNHPLIQPWIAYSPTGVLGIGYKTLYTPLTPEQDFAIESVSGRVPGEYDYWTAASFNDGLSFSQPLRASNDLSQPGNAGGNDDFSSVALDDSYLYAAWGDVPAANGPTRVFFARAPLTAYSTFPRS